jgi:pimeloyl-ACP methyl ester carboxylesterase
MVEPTRTGTLEANGVHLYYEVRGNGPTLLFISGAEGDAGEWVKVVPLLENEFTTVCYDRRGFSRSPRPAGFAGASMEEQADDAAALLTGLGLSPVFVWGNSLGALIGLCLALRHPDKVKRALLHEPPLFAGMSAVAQVVESLKQATAGGKVPFLRMLTGDLVYDSLPADYRARLAADETWMDFEFNVLEYYRPTDEELAAAGTSIIVLCGEESPPFFAEAADWLAGKLGTQTQFIAGGHGVHYDRPEVVAETIRRLARPS